MENKQAILSLAQSEKVKSGLIWCSQSILITQNLPPEQQNGALQLLQAMLGMIANEIHLGHQVSGDQVWMEVDKHLNNARVMINSGVSQEATFHFTQALTQVNRVGQKAMTHLIEQGLLQ
ncbi:MAG: hypothetical protein P8X55_01980 [Desulfosarcinaceae bacterium]|jgi:hypothetical protein